ncbi:tetratricopeptide repeat protein [Lachnoclostridium sp. Marseille-P6806]|uniref:tetratricopeptide repeat protein n=1 Tax=Lachnoclostridium sp. Marseille-P6806 TaxID=2364793 RepID=UPI00102FBEAC|nr:tetratricopeptide repeat protein [Lachnoclostridium sp. Marseille-P6806]
MGIGMLNRRNDAAGNKRGARRRRGVCVLLAALSVPLIGGCGLRFRESGAVRSGMELIGSRNFEEARELLEEAAAGGEDGRAVYRALGIAQMGTGDYAAAAQSLEKALNKSGILPDSMDYDMNFYLASCYYKLGEYDRAMEIYDAILAMDRNSVDAYEMRGATEITEGNFDAADADFREAIRRAPTDYDRIISMYSTMKQYGFEDAGKSYLSESISANLNMGGYDKGRLSYYLEDYETAKACFEQAQAGKDYRVTLMLGKTYIAQGDLNYASDVYTAYLAADQTHAEIYNELGLCYLQLGSNEKALDAFQTGQKIENSAVRQDLLFNEIVAYEKLGQFTRAAELMQSYLAAYPEDAEAQREQMFLRTR